MVRLWKEFTNEEKMESERRYFGMKRDLTDWQPDASMDLGTVGREACSG